MRSYIHGHTTRFIRTRIALLILLVSISAAGCAKIAEPQPPEIRIPRPAVDLAVRQLSDYVVLSVSKPENNTNGSQPANLKTLDIYRMTEDAKESPGGLPDEQFIKRSHRILSVASARLSEHLNNQNYVFQDRFSGETPEMYSHTYRYAVLFINNKNRSAGLSNQVSIAPVPIPPPPAGLTAEGTQNSIRLRWAAPSENMDGSQPARNGGYNIYRTEEPKRFPSTPINPEPVTSTEFKDSNFRFDATYYYSITTVGSLQRPFPESLPSNPVSITAKDTFPPAPPGDFSAIVQGNMVVLMWAHSPSADLAGYRLFRREKGGADRLLIQSELVRGMSFRDDQVTAGKQYEYEIQALDVYGNASQPVRTDLEQR